MTMIKQLMLAAIVTVSIPYLNAAWNNPNSPLNVSSAPTSPLEVFETAVEAAQQRIERVRGNDLLWDAVLKDEDPKLCALVPAVKAATEWTATLERVTSYQGVTLFLRVGRHFQAEYTDATPELRAAVATARPGSTIKFHGKLDARYNELCHQGSAIYAFSGWGTKTPMFFDKIT